MSDDSPQIDRGRRRLGLPLGLQFSLFELLAILLFAGLGTAALREGGTIAFVLVQAALWLFVGIAITALTARESWQAFAIGFVLGVAGYGLPVLYVGESEMDPYEAKLPLTKALMPVWNAISRNAYRDPTTGEEFDASEVTLVHDNFGSGGGDAASGGFNVGGSFNPYATIYFQTADGRTVDQYEKPLRREFMLAAHSLLAIAIGYVFSKFATVVYRRRNASAETPSVDAEA